MAYDLQEQEQIETLKAWWKQYGNLITWTITAALLVFAGVNGWKWYQRTQASQAVAYYEALEKAVEAKDQATMKGASGTLLSKYPRTAYAQMAALITSRAYADAGDTQNAKAQLQWVLDNGRDEEFKHVARVRLAGILLDEKAYDQALKLLSIEPPATYVSLYSDRRGDILAAMGKTAEAKVAYRTALEKAEQTSDNRQLIQLKLESLGG